MSFSHGIRWLLAPDFAPVTAVTGCHRLAFEFGRRAGQTDKYGIDVEEGRYWDVTVRD